MNTQQRHKVASADVGRTLHARTFRVQVAKRNEQGNYEVQNTFTQAADGRKQALERVAKGMYLSRSQWNGKRPEYVLRVL